MSDTNLAAAQLVGANVREADMFRANPRDANLRKADLKGAVLARVDLSAAQLQGAKIDVQELQKSISFACFTLQEGSCCVLLGGNGYANKKPPESCATSNPPNPPREGKRG